MALNLLFTLAATAVLIVAAAGNTLNAAPARDFEIELLETTYNLNEDNTADVTYHQRWKTLTAQGRTAISQIRIPYASSFSDAEIKFIKTIKKDGSVVDGDASASFDTELSQDPLAPVFIDTKYKTIVPPSLETGDSMEFTAVVHIHRWAKPGEFWFAHTLTMGLPVLSEVVVLNMPADRKVTLFESSEIRGKTEIAGSRRMETWKTANPEPPKARPEAPSPLFAVSSLPSWTTFGDWIRSLNDKAIQPSPEIQALATKLIAGKSSESDRITALYSYVATKIRYVSVSFGAGRIQPHAAAAVLHNAYGDCKDQAALLAALLRAIGLKPYFVLTTPLAGVLVPSVPTPEQFNHEFLAIDSSSGLRFLDTSMGPVQPGQLQPGVRGRQALLISDQNSALIEIPLQSPIPDRLTTSLAGKLDSAGAFVGTSRMEFQGIAETALRRLFLDASGTEKETVLKRLAGPRFGNATVSKIESSNPADLTKPFWMQCELTDEKFFPTSQAQLDIKLDWPSSVQALVDAGKPTKAWPVESSSFSQSMDLIVDPAFIINNSVATHAKTQFGNIDSEFSYDNGHLVLKRSFQLKSGRIAPEQWTAFTEFIQSAHDAAARDFTLERRPKLPSTALAQPANVGSAVVQALQRALAAGRAHDYDAAKQALLEVTKLDPRNRAAWNPLGQAYFQLHEYNEAEQSYKRQIELNPQDLYAYNNLGVVYLAQHREDDALAMFRKQIEISPRARFAHFNVGRVFASRAQWEEARHEAATAAEITPDAADRWELLGRTQIRTGHIPEARTSFDRALTLPHNSMLDNGIAYEKANAGIDVDNDWGLISNAMEAEGRLLCQPDKLAADDKCSSELVRLSNMLDTAGWVLYRQGKLDEAKPYLVSSYVIMPGLEKEIHLAVLFAAAGQLKEAISYYERARTSPYFARIDTGETRRELAKAAGGERQLDALLSKFPQPKSSDSPVARVIALVDEDGKIIDARSADSQTSDQLAENAKSLKLSPISWPDHKLRSIRTIEFRKDGDQWRQDRSYVGQPATKQ